MTQLEMFLLFDERSYKKLIADTTECTVSTILKDHQVHSSVRVLVPVVGGGEVMVTLARRVWGSSVTDAENEMRAAPEILSREVKAIVEFYREVAVMSFMQDDEDLVPVGKDLYTVDRNRLKIPEVSADEYADTHYLDCVRRSE